MPLTTAEFYNFETHQFQSTAPVFDFPELPAKLTQEEWRFIKLIAEASVKWWRFRNTSKRFDGLERNALAGMDENYKLITQSVVIARIFYQPRRIEELATYAKKNYRAILFHMFEGEFK